MADLARRVRISGQVQGVFFRAWSRDEARELGVSGWVRNCGDGSVEAHVEGEREAIDKLVERMRQGPPSARVEDVRVEEVQPEGPSGFRITH